MITSQIAVCSSQREHLKSLHKINEPLKKPQCTFCRHAFSTCHVMSLSVTAYPFPWGRGVLLLEPIPASSQGKGRVLPGQVASLSQGPHWWAMWGSVSRSRTLRHAAQSGAGIWTSDLLITSRPALPTELQSPPFSTYTEKINIFFIEEPVQGATFKQCNFLPQVYEAQM